MKHVEQTRSGSRQYRRRVPKDVSEVIPKRKLGDSQKEALAACPQYHAKVEREIEAAKKRIAGAVAASRPSASEREACAEALRRRADLVARSATEEALEIAADSLADSFPQEGYEPYGAPPVDRHTVNLLGLGPERYRPPEPTLGDALRLYLKEHLKADSPETDNRVTGLATRVVEAAIAAIGRDPLLTAITREEARAVRDHMLDRVKATGRGAGGKVSAATVSRELAILSAVVNFAKVEFGMPDTMPNPFSRLPVARVAKGQGQKASEKRDPLPPAVLTKTRARVLANAAPGMMPVGLPRSYAAAGSRPCRSRATLPMSTGPC
ncbi:hypothetical protein [Rhodobacter capsulatus]|uniref:hypothetical protein n=1 Tax=Rhodobacter capsulatus TaxID=1061 RepID=UPI0003D2EAC4|nr:hypothetical protein [Rhodobacter capsulatus]ETD83696.1 hypothetical protein U716_08160 [Rhodobacter capsulatus B6]